MKQILSIKVRNSFGVLSHVIGLFARRGCNIDSLAVAPTIDNPSFSTINLLVDIENGRLHHLILQLLKLPQVIEVKNPTEKDSYQRELLLVKIGIPADQQKEFINSVKKRGVTIVKCADEDVLLQLVEQPSKILDFLASLSNSKIESVARTGIITLPDSSESL